MRRLDPFQMLAEMPSELLSWWRAFYRVEPFGDLQADQRAGWICSQLSAVWGGTRVTPERFFPSLQEPRAEKRAALTWQEQRDWCRARAGKVIEPGK